MLLCLAAVFAGPLYQAIDFRPPIARVPVVIKELAAVTGQKLELGGRLTDEVVCVIAPQRTPKEIMDQMAFALDATWVKQGDRFILDRTAQWEKTVEDRRARAVLDLIEESMKIVPPRKDVPFDEVIALSTKEREIRNKAKMMSVAGMAKVSATTPAGNLLDEILAELTPQRVAREASKGRIVYSNDPTPMQRPLPPKLNDAVDRFVERHNALTKLILPTIPAEQPSFGTNIYDTWKPIDRASLKIHFSVSLDANFPGIRLRAHSDRQLAALANRYLQPLGIETREPFPAKKVPLSPRSLAFLTKRAKVGDTAGAAISEPAMQQELRKPTECEFLSFGNQEGFAELQKQSGRPMIAVISDVLLARPWLADEMGNLMMEQFRGMLDWDKTQVKVHQGWDIWAPAGAPNRMSRRALEASITQAGQEGRVSLDNWATLVSLDRATSARSFGEVLGLVGLEVDREWSNNPGLVRLQAQLTKEQKVQPLLDLAASELTVGQVREIAEEIYERGAQSMAHYVKTRQTVLDYMTSERTEFLPNGIVDPFRLKIKRESGEAWFTEMRWDTYRDIRRFEIGYGAFEEASVERPDLFPSVGTYVPLKAKKFYKGTATRMNFTFGINEFFDKQGTLSDEVIDTSKVYKWSELPASFRTELEKQKKELIESAEKAKKDGRIGTGVGKVPPPR